MFEKIPLFLLITILSWTNNLVISLSIYIKKNGIFKKRAKDFVGCNGWGIIMDGILANLMNITVLNFYLETKLQITWQNILTAFVIALVTTIASHTLMAIRKWEIWIMPSPWHWNEAGYWHMVSMTLQMTFIFYAVVILLQNPNLFLKDITIITLTLMSIWISFFLLALYYMSKGIKIGKFHLSSEYW